MRRKLSSEVTPRNEWHGAIKSRLFHYLCPNCVISGQTFNLSALLVLLVKWKYIFCSLKEVSSRKDSTGTKYSYCK